MESTSISSQTNYNMEINQPFPKMKFVKFTLIKLFFCFLFYADIISDITILIEYYKNENFNYFYLTLSFVLLAYIINLTIAIFKPKPKVNRKSEIKFIIMNALQIQNLIM